LHSIDILEHALEAIGLQPHTKLAIITKEFAHKLLAHDLALQARSNPHKRTFSADCLYTPSPTTEDSECAAQEPRLEPVRSRENKVIIELLSIYSSSHCAAEQKLSAVWELHADMFVQSADNAWLLDYCEKAKSDLLECAPRGIMSP
jgi:hypothetical protein